MRHCWSNESERVCNGLFLSSSLGTCPFGGTNMALPQGDIPWLQGGTEMPMKAAIRGQSTYLWPLRSRWLHNEQGFTESYGKITMDVPHRFSLCMTFHQPMCSWLFVLPRCDSSVISYMTTMWNGMLMPHYFTVVAAWYRMIHTTKTSRTKMI
jgi:hypothetical protein